MRIALFFICSFLIFSCKSDMMSDASVEAVKSMKIIHPDSLTLPSACELISEATVKKLLKVNEKTVLNIKDSSNPEQKRVKSCFFRWDDPAMNFPGIMLQVTTNEVFEDKMDFLPGMIQTLLNEGSMEVDANSPNKFKKFMVDDITGAYSYKMSRFHWNLGTNYGFMLAFNVPLSEDDMVEIAEEIAREANVTLAKKI